MAWTRTLLLAAVCAAPALVSPALVSPAWAQSSAFVGHWHLNRAQSTMPPGEAPPGDLVTDITRLDVLHARWSVSVRGSDGKTDTQTFDTPANGEFYPVDADTTASVQLTNAGLQTVFRDTNGSTDTITCNLSQDQQKMTCDGAITGQNGAVSRYRDVFDRS